MNMPLGQLCCWVDTSAYVGWTRCGSLTDCLCNGKDRCAYTNYLMTLPLKERKKEVRQFILDMMDWHDQSDEEQFYIDLYEVYKKHEV